MNNSSHPRGHTQGHATLHGHGHNHSQQSPQPSIVLAPAKHTTVVTTTTTTTTTYSPIPLPPLPPPSSPATRERDAQLYPLLHAPVPRSLLQFPLVFPGGTRAIFRDGSTKATDQDTPDWSEEYVGGNGWQLLRSTSHDGKGKAKEDVVDLSEAVDRYTGLRKRPHSVEQLPPGGTQSIVEMTSTTTMDEDMPLHHPQPTHARSPPPRKKARALDLPASRSNAAPPSPLPSPQPSPSSAALWAQPHEPTSITSPQSPPQAPAPFQPDLSLTTLLALPQLLNQFVALPPNLQTHLLLTFLRHSTLPVLRTLHSVLTPTLARDFLTLLPAELSCMVLSFLPPSSLFSASRVSRAWRALIDSEPSLWRSLLRRNGLWFGGASEAAFAQEVSSHRTRHPPPLLHDNNMSPLPHPHPFKLLFRSRYTIMTRWMHTTPKHLHFPAHGSSVVTCLLLSRRRIISASDDHSIHVYDPMTGDQVRMLEGHEGGVWALAVCTRKIKGQALNAIEPGEPQTYDVLVSGSTDRTVRMWDLSTGRNTHVFGGHTSTVRCLSIVRPAWIDRGDDSGIKERWPKRTLVVTGSRDHTLRVWKLPRYGEEEYRCYGADGGDGDPAEEDTSENPYHVRLLSGHAHAVRALAAHGRTLVSGSYDATVRVWDIETGACKFVLTGHSQKVYSVVLDPVRNQACSGSMDGTVRIWSLATGQLLHTLTGHTSLVGLLSLSPTTLVSAAADSTLRVWDPSTGTLIHTLSAHSGAITCFQHDEFKVLSGSDGTLKMWDTRDGSVVRDLLTGITGVWQVVFDERFCVAASNRQDKTYLDVWDFGGEDPDSGDKDVEAAKIGDEDVESDEEEDEENEEGDDAEEGEEREEEEDAKMDMDMESGGGRSRGASAVEEDEDDDNERKGSGGGWSFPSEGLSTQSQTLASMVSRSSIGSPPRHQEKRPYRLPPMGVSTSAAAARVQLPSQFQETPTRPRARSSKGIGLGLS